MWAASGAMSGHHHLQGFRDRPGKGGLKVPEESYKVLINRVSGSYAAGALEFGVHSVLPEGVRSEGAGGGLTKSQGHSLL